MTYPFKENTIYTGRCVEVLPEFPDESVDLIYLDPPFYSKKKYEVIWGDGAEKRAFKDWRKGEINQFKEWMRQRIQYMWDLLKPNGNLFLHCDKHANYKLREVLNDIFGKENFRNEIIWHYRKMGNPSKRFAQNHDTILFYSKGDENFHRDLHNEEVPRALYNRFQKILGNDDKLRWKEAKKRNQQLLDHYINKTKKELDRELKDDDVILDFSKSNKKYKKLDDVWDIPPIKGNSKEDLSYPTQKPKELLKRIVKSSSKKGDIVLDPFCGCGTTVAAAEELNRNWIGIDLSPTACVVMRKRMRERYDVEPDILGIPNTPKDLKNIEPHDFENWVVRAFDGKHKQKKSADMGVDGYTNQGAPIQVKQSESVGRNVIDNFQTAVRREKNKKGIIVAFSFTSGAVEEVARVKGEEDINIELKTVEDLLEESQKDDIPAMFIKEDGEKSDQTKLGGKK